MKRSLLVKILFYAVLVAAAIALGLLVQKNTSKAPVVTNQPTINESVTTNTETATPPPEQTNNREPATENITCIITVDGQKYDVQPLRSIHPGGDIYKCGTDMSAIYHGKHGDSVKRIEKYLVP